MFFLAVTVVGWIDFVYRKVAARNIFQSGISAGRNGSNGVLIMSLSAIVPEKSRGNKKCDEEEEEEERHILAVLASL